MNPLETFGEFSQKLTTTDLMLYAGIGIVLWVLFKDQLSPVQKVLQQMVDKFYKKTTSTKTNTNPVVVVDNQLSNDNHDKTDIFFDLVVSWKQTRDLAVKSGCVKAVEVADSMFPYLSPVVCNETEEAKHEE